MDVEKIQYGHSAEEQVPKRRSLQLAEGLKKHTRASQLCPLVRKKRKTHGRKHPVVLIHAGLVLPTDIFAFFP